MGNRTESVRQKDSDNKEQRKIKGKEDTNRRERGMWSSSPEIPSQGICLFQQPSTGKLSSKTSYVGLT